MHARELEAFLMEVRPILYGSETNTKAASERLVKVIDGMLDAIEAGTFTYVPNRYLSPRERVAAAKVSVRDLCDPAFTPPERKR
jgi:hypothetical protein